MKKGLTIFTILFILSTIFNPLFAQTQIGQDIDGTPGNAVTWGQSLSMSFDGKRLAIGMPSNFGLGFAQVYELVGNTWVQLGTDIFDQDNGSQWGKTVSLSADGNRLAIGGEENGVAGSNAGLVQVYEWTGTSWVQIGTDISGVSGDKLGTSVSLSANGNRLVVGAPDRFIGTTERGYARVYQWTGTNWTQLGADIIGQQLQYDNFGTAVSMSADGNRVAVSTPYYDNINIGTNIGYTSIYELVGSNWIKMGSSIHGEFAEDYSGASVSLSADGSRVATGAFQHDNLTGHGRVFEWTGSNWVQVGANIDGEAPGDEAGFPVSLSADGNKLAIGGPFNDGNGTDAGHTRIYEWLGGQWTQIGIDIEGENAGDVSGWWVALSPDGNSVAISAPWNEDNGEFTGHVRVFSTLLTLPVELADFKAKAINEEVLLKWTTASESNNKGFDIEHSTDGTTWQKLDFVRGQGTSSITNDYMYTHTNPTNGINYYRLKQLDFDGAFEYSKVVNAHISGRGGIDIFPNPSSESIAISGITYDTAKITDTSGKNVLIIENTQPTIDISHLKNGIYFIEIISGNSRMIKKIVKR